MSDLKRLNKPEYFDGKTIDKYRRDGNDIHIQFRDGDEAVIKGEGGTRVQTYVLDPERNANRSS